jgi:threonyl-tRNA synthetase
LKENLLPKFNPGYNWIKYRSNYYTIVKGNKLYEDSWNDTKINRLNEFSPRDWNGICDEEEIFSMDTLSLDNMIIWKIIGRTNRNKLVENTHHCRKNINTLNKFLFCV